MPGPGFIKAGRSEVSVWLCGIRGELSPASSRLGDVRLQVRFVAAAVSAAFAGVHALVRPQLVHATWN